MVRAMTDQISRRRRLGGLATASVLLLSLTACGGGDDGKDDFAKPKQNADVTFSGDPIKVMTFTPYDTDTINFKAALDVARKYGVVPDDFLPFASGRLFTGSGPAFFAAAARWKVAGYFNLKLDPEVWREWLATQGPVLVRLDVDDTWRQAIRTRGRLDAYQVPAGPAGHAAALVGYGPDRWIIRNSWGAAWGDRGFAYASPGYARDAITEAYGVVV
mgnify:CR=1 FL=1